MARIRLVEIRNFRSIQSLDWRPTPGINCMVGPGDSGKSTVIDAIEACLSARRNLTFSDSDFYNLNAGQVICIRVTLGSLKDSLKDLEAYGEFLRGFDEISETLMDEPMAGSETVLTIQLMVGADLEPVWRLYSERTAHDESLRNLSWTERVAIAPTRLGSHANTNLSWAKGSVLNRLSDDKMDVALELVNAARDARTGFGDRAGTQLKSTLETVTTVAQKLGVQVGESAKALLDPHSMSFGESAISLHSDSGIPLRNLGTGSSRLLLAGLHREAASEAGLILVDEVEFGLEPHRLTSLLHSLGSKEDSEPLQVIMTTHSPVVVRELSGRQLHVLRNAGAKHTASMAGNSDEVQSTLRCDPEAFLAKTVIVCEGSSEIGLVRGLDIYFTKNSDKSMHAAGVAFVNAGGGSPEKCLYRAMAIRQLGYRVIAFIDNDKPASPVEVDKFQKMGGVLVTWTVGSALEDVLFRAFPVDMTGQLIDLGIELTSLEIVEEDIKKIAGYALSIQQIRNARTVTGNYSDEHRKILGLASRIRGRGWFKSISKMENVAANIIAPKWNQGTDEFQDVLKTLYGFCF